MRETCPRTVAISAYLDDELPTGAERAGLQAHLAVCPACAALLSDLRELHGAFQALPDEPLGVDLSEVVRGRLAAEPRAPRAPSAPQRRRSWRDLLPMGIGASAAVTLGLVMGSMLVVAPGAVVAPRVAAMAVFEPVAPGGLCIGFDACYAPRGARAEGVRP